MSTVKKVVIAAAVAAVALGAAGCSSVPSAKEWAEEVAKAGFTDPVVISDDGQKTVVMASAEACRLRFIGDKQTARLFITIPNSPIKEEGSYISDPSLPLIRDDERFAGCFSSEKQP